jgi:uncharacterized repeat protein (TIGR02543 family)
VYVPVQTYSVTFISDGQLYQTKTIDANTSVKVPQDPVKSGYTFVGWFNLLTDTNAYDFSNKVTSDLTLYAKFIKNEDAVDLVKVTFVVDSEIFDIQVIKSGERQPNLQLIL